MQHVVRPHGNRSTSSRLREEITGDGCAAEPRSFRLRAEENVSRESDADEAELQRLPGSHFRLVRLRAQSNYSAHKHDRFEQGKRDRASFPA